MTVAGAPLLVTGLFDLVRREGNARRPVADYLSFGELVLSLENRLVVFADPELEGPIRARRAAFGLLDRTTIVPLPFEELPAARLVPEIEAARRRHPVENANPGKDTPRYVALGWSKLGLVARAIALTEGGTSHAAWIDFGIAHIARARSLAESRLFSTAPGRVRLLRLRRPEEGELADPKSYFSRLRRLVAGGLLAGETGAMTRFADLFDAEARRALDAGFGPSEEQLFPLLVAAHPDLFDLVDGDYDSLLEPRRPGRSVALNMIVKDEAPILERFLKSVLPVVDSYVVCDTGSTDGTPDLVRSYFARAGIPGALHTIPFVDFETARNKALDLARLAWPRSDYFLLADADMELVVDDPAIKERLSAPLYSLKQTAGTLSYWNPRVVRRDLQAHYVGATHEYLSSEVPAEPLAGLWIRDHACGSSRTEKTERDLRLLEARLARSPDDARSMFYLAQTLREAGRPAEAAEWYRRRIDAGGWEAEVWYARFMLALCHAALGEDDLFERGCREAFALRPSRSEPLYHLARHFRERGRAEECLDLCEEGERIPRPENDLFVEDAVYTSGFREEISIAGFYSAKPERRARGRKECFDLAVDRTVPSDRRVLARQNAIHYAPFAAELFGSFESTDLEIPDSGGYRPLNPSIAIAGGIRAALVRTVNYDVEQMLYTIRDADGVIRTRNHLAILDADFRIERLREIRDLSDGPPAFPFPVRGFEDCRLIACRGRLFASATVRDRNPEGRCEIALLEIDESGDVSAVRVQRSVRPDLHQKNWVPLVRGEDLFFVYRTDPTVILAYDFETGACRVASADRSPLALDHVRGGSGAVRSGDGWLYAVHEAVLPGPDERQYLHRFVLLGDDFRVRAASDPFRLVHRGIEFAAGLARDEATGRLVLSFGVEDRRACLGFLDEAAVLASLRPA